MTESVDLLGFWFEIKVYGKNNHRHIFDISESCTALTGGLFFRITKILGKKAAFNGLITAFEYSKVSLSISVK